MTREFMQKLLDSGEGFTIEYKKNENKLSSDVFETWLKWKRTAIRLER